MTVSGDLSSHSLQVTWSPTNQQVRNCYADLQFATEFGARGGPRFSDRLLRWSPDPTGGIWNATQETELPG